MIESLYCPIQSPVCAFSYLVYRIWCHLFHHRWRHLLVARLCLTKQAWDRFWIYSYINSAWRRYLEPFVSARTWLCCFAAVRRIIKHNRRCLPVFMWYCCRTVLLHVSAHHWLFSAKTGHTGYFCSQKKHSKQFCFVLRFFELVPTYIRDKETETQSCVMLCVYAITYIDVINVYNVYKKYL